MHIEQIEASRHSGWSSSTHYQNALHKISLQLQSQEIQLFVVVVPAVVIVSFFFWFSFALAMLSFLDQKTLFSIFSKFRIEFNYYDQTFIVTILLRIILNADTRYKSRRIH